MSWQWLTQALCWYHYWQLVGDYKSATEAMQEHHDAQTALLFCTRVIPQGE